MPLDNQTPQTEDAIIAALTPEQVKLLAFWREIVTGVVKHFSTLRRQHGLSDVELYIPEQRDIRELEKRFAYDSAVADFDNYVPYVEGDGYWLDTAACETGSEEIVADAVTYLAFRSLLDRHPEHSTWVQIRDESEPAA